MAGNQPYSRAAFPPQHLLSSVLLGFELARPPKSIFCCVVSGPHARGGGAASCCRVQRCDSSCFGKCDVEFLEVDKLLLAPAQSVQRTPLLLPVAEINLK